MNETKDTAKSQVDKFREAAREVETDDREEAFDERLRRIAKPSPPDPGRDPKEKPAK